MTTTETHGDQASAAFAHFAATGESTSAEEAWSIVLPKAYALARQLCGNSANAEDALQDAALRLLRMAWRYRGDVPFEAWVCRLVHEACGKQRRARGRRQRHEANAGASTMTIPQDSPPDEDQTALIRSTVCELRAPDREVISLHYFAGLDHGAIAKALGTKANTVAQRLVRARERLRRRLETAGVSCSTALLSESLLNQTPAPIEPACLAQAKTFVSEQIGTAVTQNTTTFIIKGKLLIMAHPVISALGTVIITALISIAIPAIPAADSEPSTPTDSVQGHSWQGPARHLLPYRDPQAMIGAAVDIDSLRQQLKTVRPFTILADPEAAAVRDEALRLWDYLERYDNIYPIHFQQPLRSAHGAVLSAQPKTDLSYPFLLVADLGEANRAVTASVKLYGEAANKTAFAQQGFMGYSHAPDGENSFLATKDSLFAAGSAHYFERLAPTMTIPLETPVAALAAHLELLPLKQALIRLSEKHGPLVTQRVDSIFPGWQNTNPRLQMSLDVVDNLLQADVHFRDAPRILFRTIDPSVLRHRTEACLTLAIGIDIALAYSWMDQDNLSLSLKRIGIDNADLLLTRIRAAATGDILLQSRWHGTIPTFAGVIGIKDLAEARSLIATLATQLNGTSQADGQRWTIVTPAGLLQLVLDKDLLYFGTDQELMAKQRANTKATSAAVAVLVEADLQPIAATLLPLLQMLAMNSDFRDVDLVHPRDHVLSVYLNAAMYNSRGRKQLMNLLSSQDRLRSRHFIDPRRLPTDDEMSRLCTVYGPKQRQGSTPTQAYRLVMRTDSDYRVYTFHQRGRNFFVEQVAANPEALSALIGDRERLIGPQPTDLLINRTVPDLDFNISKLLLPPSVIQRHLPPYTLRLQATDDGMHLCERGLPVASICGGPMLAAIVWDSLRVRSSGSYRSSVLEDQILSWVEQEEGPAIADRHRAKLVAVRKLVQAMKQRHNTASKRGKAVEHPKALSHCIALGLISAKDLAPFLNGDAVEIGDDRIDRIGRWDVSATNEFISTKVAEPVFGAHRYFHTYDRLWAVDLESGWQLVLSGAYANVHVTKTTYDTTPVVLESKPWLKKKGTDEQPPRKKTIGAEDF